MRARSGRLVAGDLVIVPFLSFDLPTRLRASEEQAREDEVEDREDLCDGTQGGSRYSEDSTVIRCGGTATLERRKAAGQEPVALNLSERESLAASPTGSSGRCGRSRCPYPTRSRCNRVMRAAEDEQERHGDPRRRARRVRRDRRTAVRSVAGGDRTVARSVRRSSGPFRRGQRATSRPSGAITIEMPALSRGRHVRRSGSRSGARRRPSGRTEALAGTRSLLQRREVERARAQRRV